MATETAVKNTTKKEKLPIIRYHFFRSFNEMDQDASNNSGGRKIKNIIFGLTWIAGKPGIKLMPNPAITNKIG